MAHFVQLDENDIVIKVIVIDNNDILDNDGKESEELGVKFCKKVYGENTVWLQTSYNSSFRKNYAIIGEIYDRKRDAFRVKEPPLLSWILDEETCQWKPPINPPSDFANKLYNWDETTKSWIDKTPDSPYPSWTFSYLNLKWTPPTPHPTDGKRYTWDEKTLSWVELVPILDGKPPEVI
jgi:hypothetical protein